ncbi:hypothetical protein ZWY2020_002150 [Hordeum vulgare]|nr:hypothetical protein ZWY2020_002150 [Hordeum vulgare]
MGLDHRPRIPDARLPLAPAVDSAVVAQRHPVRLAGRERRGGDWSRQQDDRASSIRRAGAMGRCGGARRRSVRRGWRSSRASTAERVAETVQTPAERRQLPNYLKF